jgi:uncharacterized protein YuzB (UPF0349 family)
MRKEPGSVYHKWNISVVIWEKYTFFLWPLCCLFFNDIQVLITPLVSSNSFNNLINNIYEFCLWKSLFQHNNQMCLFLWKLCTLYLYLYFTFTILPNVFRCLSKLEYLGAGENNLIQVLITPLVSSNSFNNLINNIYEFCLWKSLFQHNNQMI